MKEIEIDKSEKDYSKILTNWTAHTYKIERNGIERKKSGGKRKAEITKEYLTAKELRSMKRVKITDEHDTGNTEVEPVGDEENTMPSDCIELHVDQLTYESENTKEDENRKDQAYLNKKDEEKQKKRLARKKGTAYFPQTYDTYLGIKLLFPGVSQNTI